jgi:hypothetical protein
MKTVVVAFVHGSLFDLRKSLKKFQNDSGCWPGLSVKLGYYDESVLKQQNSKSR